MHIAQRDQEAKSTPKLRDVREINQECSVVSLISDRYTQYIAAVR
jgi:hypothetical protein